MEALIRLGGATKRYAGGATALDQVKIGRAHV